MAGKNKIPKIRKRTLKAGANTLRRWRRDQLLAKYLRRNLPELVIHCTNTKNIKSEQEEMIAEQPIDEIVKKEADDFGPDTSSTTTASEGYQVVNMDEVLSEINESDKTMEEVNENTDPLSSSTETASEGEPDVTFESGVTKNMVTSERNESDKIMKEVNENFDPLSSSTETASEGEPYEK